MAEPMKSDAPLQLARHAIKDIHDESILVRALFELADLEQARAGDPQITLAHAERLIANLNDAATRVSLICDLAQVFVRLGRDPYRLLDFAKSAAMDATLPSQIYVALVEAKLGFQVTRNLRWAEELAGVQTSAEWLVRTQATIVRIQAESGAWSAARCTIRRISDPLQQLCSRCDLALAAHERQNDWALDTFDTSPQLDELTNPHDRVHAYGALATTAHAMKVDCLDFLQHALDAAAQMRDPDERMQAGMQIARVVARCLNPSLARQCLEQLPESALPEALIGICEELAQVGAIDDTRELAGQLMFPGHRDRALLCIVRSLARSEKGSPTTSSVSCREFQP